MAAQYITLEEAASRLGLPTDEFKKRLKTEWTHLVPMRDGPTLRFRVNQIDELARQLGAASDPGLPLASLDLDAPEPGSEDFQVSPVVSGRSSKVARPQPQEEPLLFDASDDDIFSLSADEPQPHAKKGSSSKHEKKPDSDVRIEGRKQTPRPASHDDDVIPTEEISLDLSGGPGSAVIKGGSSAKLSAPKSSVKLTPDSSKKRKTPDSGKKLSSDSGKDRSGQGLTDSSEFELSLDADSDDFELQLNADSSDEVDLGSSPDDGSGRAGKSGINLHEPADSGVSLEKGKNSGISRNLSGRKPAESSHRHAPTTPKPSDESDSDVDFELSLEPDSTSAPAPSGVTRAGSKPGKAPVESEPDSEFELTLDDSSMGSSLESAALADEENKGDIFETDFEIPPMSDESGSEAVAIESDTDLEDRSEADLALEEGDIASDDETGSQVVLLEDEPDVGQRPKSRRRPASGVSGGDVDLADVELEEEEGSVSSAMRRVRRTGDEEDEEEAVPAGAVAPPAPWGPLPAIILFPAFFLLFFGSLMGYEALQTMMGYQQPRKPAAPLVRGVAKTLDMDLRDQ